MKKYFAKYLPVEGNDDKNCKWQWYNNVKNTGWEDISCSDMDGIIAHGLNPPPQFRKLKLFLCSKDIKVGDKITNGILHQSFSNFQNKEAHIKAGWFKIIGEISPEALSYTKEKMEYNGTQIAWDATEGTDEIFLLNDDFSPIPKDYKGIIYIKGPCGHFH